MIRQIGPFILSFLGRVFWHSRFIIYPAALLAMVGPLIYFVVKNYRDRVGDLTGNDIAIIAAGIAAIALIANMLATTVSSLVPWRTQIHYNGLLKCYARAGGSGCVTLRLEAQGRITEKIQGIGYFIAKGYHVYWFDPEKNRFPIILE